MRQMVLADDDLDVNSKGIGRAKNLDHSSACRSSRSWKARDLHVDGKTFERREWILRGDPAALQLLRLFAENSVRRNCGFRNDLVTFGDENRLGHAVIEGCYIVPFRQRQVFPRAAAMRAGVVEDSHYSWVAAREDSGRRDRNVGRREPRGASSTRTSSPCMAPLSSLGRDEEIVFPVRASVGTDEGVAVAMQVDAAGDEALAGLGVAPLLERCCAMLARSLPEPQMACSSDRRQS